ncbi:MAG: DNA-formamidopyrimidine glycosylase [Candidatus Omnitrophica bacterium]|nr:DNA-formamidopyrimidine glycosylase [Candidatus Omnitrophota bacterium]
MPELPEVETVSRDLSGTLLGLTIKKVEIIDARVVRDILPAKFCAVLKAKIIKRISRRGKAIIFGFDSGPFFIVQLMMTGQLVHAAALPVPVLKETKVIFTLSDGSHLLYNDQRLFGRLTLIENLNDFRHFQLLGPEPFETDFNPDYMQGVLKNKTVAIKKVLLDHGFVAGIGNIYASEILFRCRIDPRRNAKSLDVKEITSLHYQIIEVLQEAIEYRGSSMRNYRDGQGKKGRFNERIRVYARENESCPNCSHKVLRITQGGRSTFFCKKCQR